MQHLRPKGRAWLGLPVTGPAEERVGVEPTLDLRPNLISNQAPSATRPSLQDSFAHAKADRLSPDAGPVDWFRGETVVGPTSVASDPAVLVRRRRPGEGTPVGLRSRGRLPEPRAGDAPCNTGSGRLMPDSAPVRQLVRRRNSTIPRSQIVDVSGRGRKGRVGREGGGPQEVFSGGRCPPNFRDVSRLRSPPPGEVCSRGLRPLARDDGIPLASVGDQRLMAFLVREGTAVVERHTK